MVSFRCLTCSKLWFVPPNNCCPRCGFAPAEPDPIVWQVNQLKPYPVFVSAQMKDEARLERIAKMGIKTVVDIAGDPDGKYVWRPTDEMYRQHGIVATKIEEVEDSRKETSLPDHAFTTVLKSVIEAIANDSNVLVHCAAGLARSPHLLYGSLRFLGHSPEGAWWIIHEARPFVEQYPPYIAAAERWLRTVS